MVATCVRNYAFGREPLPYVPFCGQQDKGARVEQHWASRRLLRWTVRQHGGEDALRVEEACCVVTRDGAERVPSTANALGLDGPLRSLPQASSNRRGPVHAA